MKDDASLADILRVSRQALRNPGPYPVLRV
jgi:hypothetical protein